MVPVIILELSWRKISPFIYDLAGTWKAMTGLPFVFAAWISNKVLDPDWIHRFEAANTYGIQNISRVLDELTANDFDMRTYFTQYLSYDLNEEKKKGMELFLSMLKEKN